MRLPRTQVPMSLATRIIPGLDAMRAGSVLLLVAITVVHSREYNFSRSLSPWIKIKESYIQKEIPTTSIPPREDPEIYREYYARPILYDGATIQNVIGTRTSWKWRSTFLPADFLGNLYNGRLLPWFSIIKSFDLDDIIPEYVLLESVTVKYRLLPRWSTVDSVIAVVVVDKNDEDPEFTAEAPSIIELSEDTCQGQEIYNFEYQVRDRDFADKPNEAKLQLVILESEPELDTFSVSGRLGIRLQKALNKSASPYVLELVLEDQASRYGESHYLTVKITDGWTRDSENSSNSEKCRKLNSTHSDYLRFFDCSSPAYFSISESNVSRGLQITYRGNPIKNISRLNLLYCNNVYDSTFTFVNLTDNGTLIISTEFNLDSITTKDAIQCIYELTCKANARTTTISIIVLDENDEAPTFTDDAHKIITASQVKETVYNFERYVVDSDFMDQPNDLILELVIIGDLFDAHGTVMSGNNILVTERMKLTIQPPLNVTGYPPYQLTLALKDSASRIGPHHNVTIYILPDPNVYCQEKTYNVSQTRVVTLPNTRAPSLVMLPCLSTGKPLLVASCERKNSTLAEYNVTQVNAKCSDTMSFPKLADLYLVPITESNIDNITMEVENVTSLSYKIEPVDLSYVSYILSNLSHFFENDTIEPKLLLEVSTYVAGIVSNLMDVRGDVFEDARSKDRDLTARIVGSFDTMLLQLANAIDKNGSKITAEDLKLVQAKNLAYQVTSRTAIVGLGACSLDNGTTVTVTVAYNSSTSSDCLSINGQLLTELKLSRAVLIVPRTFVVYTSAVLFGSGAAPGAAVLSSQLTTTHAHEDNSGMEHAVSLKQRINKTTVEKKGSLACGYWSFSTNRWETDGCSRQPTDDGQGMLVCTCDHLTNFAVLMVPCVGDCNEELHDKVLSYMSLIFLSVSCVALSLALVSFCLCRAYRQSDAQRLTACLSASLLCMNLLFIFGIDAQDKEASICSALAVTLHYFLLTSFLFMTAEVILSYMRLVKVFDAHVSHFIWKVLAICLGIPAGVVIGVRFGYPELYKPSQQYCWVQPKLQIYGVMLPVGLVITVNLVLFVLIARSLKSRPHLRSTLSERKQALRQAKALVAIFVLLGVTWAFGLLATIEVSSVVFQYLFVISNALQGLFVSIFHAVKAPPSSCCVKNKKIAKGVGSTAKNRRNAHGTRADMSLSTRTTTSEVSGSRK